MSDSPSTIETTRRPTPRRRAIVDAAIGSVGETIAPSVNAAAHGIPSTTECATTATTTIVTSTSPTESTAIGLTFVRSSRSDVK